MKKKEAEEIAIDVSRVIMEYIEAILTDSVKVTGKITFVSEKVEGYSEKMCVILISVPEKEFFRPINSKIPSIHSGTFHTQILHDLIDHFLYSDGLKIGRFYSIKGMTGPNFEGLDAEGPTGNQIKINFSYIGSDLKKEVDSYNQAIDDYQREIEISEKKETSEVQGKVK